MNVTMGQYADPNGQMYQQAGSGVGTMAGAALGSFFPGVGTALGGALGGAAGGALGGLLGGGKKKAKVKIFPLGTKENPGWPGFSGGGTLQMGSTGAPPPSAGGQALGGLMSGFLSGGGAGGGGLSGAMGQMFGQSTGGNIGGGAVGMGAGGFNDQFAQQSLGMGGSSGMAMPMPYHFGPGMTL